MNWLKLLIIFGILFFSASAFGIEVCEWSTAANAAKAGAQITALTYSDSKLYAGTTGYESKMIILNAPTYTFSEILAPMSAVYDLKNISDGTPMMAGNQSKIFQFTNSQWNEICAATFSNINNQYFNKIISGISPSLLGGTGNNGLANIIVMSDNDCGTFTKAGPVSSSSLQSLVKDNENRLWVLNNASRIYKLNNISASWEQITNIGIGGSGTMNMIFATSTGRIYLAKKIGGNVNFYFRAANSPVDSVWTSIGTIAQSNRIADMVEHIGITYALAEMANGTVSLYRLDNATNTWMETKNFSEVTNASRLLIRDATSMFVSGFNASGAKLLRYGCYMNNPPTAKLTAKIDEGIESEADVEMNTASSVYVYAKGSSDPEGQPLTYVLEQTLPDQTPPGEPQLITNNEILFMSGAVGIGVYEFKLTITDSVGQTATDTIKITISAGIATTANAGEDKTVKPGESVKLMGMGWGANNTGVTYSWGIAADSPNKNITLANANSANVDFNAWYAGEQYKLTLTVTADNGTTANDDALVTVAMPILSSAADTSGCQWKEKYAFGSTYLPLSLAKAGDGTLYVGVQINKTADLSKGAVYKSIDNGTTWAIVGAELDHPYDPFHLLIDSDGDLFVAGGIDKTILKLKADKSGWDTITGTIQGDSIEGIVETFDKKIVVLSKKSNDSDYTYKIDKTAKQISMVIKWAPVWDLYSLSSQSGGETIFSGGIKDGNAYLNYTEDGYANWPYPTFPWKGINNIKQPISKDPIKDVIMYEQNKLLIITLSTAEIHRFDGTNWSSIGKLFDGGLGWKLRKIDSTIYALASSDNAFLIQSTDNGTTWSKYPGLESTAFATEIVKSSNGKLLASVLEGDKGDIGKIYYLCGAASCGLCDGQQDNQPVCGGLTCPTGQNLDVGTCACTTPPNNNQPNNGSPGSPGSNPIPPQNAQELVFSKTLSSENLKDADIESLLGTADKNSEQETAVGLTDKIEVTKEIKTYAKGSDANTIVKITIKNNDKVKYKDLKIIDVIPKEVLDNAIGKITTSATYNILVEDPVIEFGISELAKGASKTIEYSFKKDLSKLSTSDVNKWKASFAYAGQEVIDLCKNVKCTVNACKTSECVATTGKCKYTNKEDGTSCGTNKKCGKGKCLAVKADINANADMNFIDANINIGFELPQLPYMEIGIAIILLILAVAGFWFVKNKEKQEENAEETAQADEEFKF